MDGYTPQRLWLSVNTVAETQAKNYPLLPGAFPTGSQLDLVNQTVEGSAGDHKGNEGTPEDM